MSASVTPFVPRVPIPFDARLRLPGTLEAHELVVELVRSVLGKPYSKADMVSVSSSLGDITKTARLDKGEDVEFITVWKGFLVQLPASSDHPLAAKDFPSTFHPLLRHGILN